MAGSQGERTLHIAPGDSAGGSLRQAIVDAGRDEEVLAYLDDLSCGPIDSDEPSLRAAWWAALHEPLEVEGSLKAFWSRIATTEDRLVVWFGRHSAVELAFLLNWAARLGERSYDVVDVTGLRLPYNKRDGARAVTEPLQAVSVVPADGLQSLLGSERPFTTKEREAARQRWQQLKRENAPFRVVTATGLASAPIDHFDSLLLAQTTTEWQKVALVVGRTIVYNLDPYLQTGDGMLLTRVVALVDEGKLLADGDVWDTRSCRVRRPD